MLDVGTKNVVWPWRERGPNPNLSTSLLGSFKKGFKPKGVSKSYVIALYPGQLIRSAVRLDWFIPVFKEKATLIWTIAHLINCILKIMTRDVLQMCGAFHMCGPPVCVTEVKLTQSGATRQSHLILCLHQRALVHLQVLITHIWITIFTLFRDAFPQSRERS